MCPCKVTNKPRSSKLGCCNFKLNAVGCSLWKTKFRKPTSNYITHSVRQCTQTNCWCFLTFIGHCASTLKCLIGALNQPCLLRRLAAGLRTGPSGLHLSLSRVHVGHFHQGYICPAKANQGFTGLTGCKWRPTGRKRLLRGLTQTQTGSCYKTLCRDEWGLTLKH